VTDPTLTTTDRTRVRRAAARGSDDRAAAYAVLDEGLVAHVGIQVDGQPYVIPMAYGRDGDRLLLHGSVASRLMRGLAGGVQVCVTVTLVDALVMARSAFHHSMNYRSVVVLGEARRIDDPDEILAALDLLVDHIVPGRSAELRPHTDVEVRQTMMLELPIDEASLKARTGGPNDDEADLDLPVWAGVLPLATFAGTPQPDARAASSEVPDTVAGWQRPGSPTT
jgi:nitroimidazol reductase NimA-like FMN-containing flavoprotein (pyridoxamine 5'-phosphate oxidase superfamily)